MRTCLFICFTSSLGMLESKNVLDTHTKVKSLLIIKASTNGTLINSWAAKLFKFQLQNLMLDDHFGSRLIWIFPDNKSRRCLKLFVEYLKINIIGQSFCDTFRCTFKNKNEWRIKKNN